MISSGENGLGVHLRHGSSPHDNGVVTAILLLLLLVLLLRLTISAPIGVDLHPELEELVQVQGVRPDKGRVVPRLPGRVPEIAEVEEARPAPGGEKDVLLEGNAALGEEALHEQEGLQGHDPVLGAVEAAGDDGDAGVDHGARVAGEAEDLGHVALVGGVLAMAGGLDNGDFEVGEGAAGGGDLGQADAGVILECSYDFFDLDRGHAFFFALFETQE